MDDFVLTLSDHEEEEEVTDDQDDGEREIPSTSTKAIASKKRKRKLNGSGASHAAQEEGIEAGKKRRKLSATEQHEYDTSSSAGEGWADGGEDDGTLNPDFEFQVGAVEGDLGDDLDGWGLSHKNGSGHASHSSTVNVDDLVQRRRTKHQQTTAAEKKHEEAFLEGPQDAETQDTLQGVDIEGEETLADDAFGMSAHAEEEDDDNDEDDDDEEHSPVSHEKHSNGNTTRLSLLRGSAKEDDDSGSDASSVAAPMPHPDDDDIDPEVINEETSRKENARRAAFFAPEEPKTVDGHNSFQGFPLSRPILKGLTAAGFTNPTPIQTKTIPVALLGKDVVGGAVTGSGKTAAFIIPILERLLFRPKKVPMTRVAILMPTRELAVQCFNVATKLASFTDITFARLVGGLSLREQEQELKKRPDIVIATPGRFIDHVRNTSSFAVESLEILVLDEADRMLDDGFADELDEILRLIPRSRQTMLFSATMTQDVDKLIRVGMTRPARLMVDSSQRTVQGLVQEFIKLKSNNNEFKEERRLAYLLHLCKTVYTSKTIVFVASKVSAHRIKVLLSWEGVMAAELHGSMTQEQRLAAISSFRTGQSSHLLATDLASRGLDIPKVETVLNYTVPTTSTTYLHRVGRTARAGRGGVSCTLFDSSAKPSTSGKAAKASERTLLKPILKQAKSQSAKIRTRSLPSTVIDDLTQRIRSIQPEIDAILDEEKEERLIQQSERDLTKGDNLVEHAHEIASRPRRTWFQSERDKKASSQVGMDERKGLANASEQKKDKKRKLSNNEKKKLQNRDERSSLSNTGWKKRSDERAGKGVLQNLKVAKTSKKMKKNAKKLDRPTTKGGSLQKNKPQATKTRKGA